MSCVVITGSSTALGLMAGQLLLVEQGHQVLLHGRDQARTRRDAPALPQAQAVVLGDLSSIAGARSAEEQVNQRPALALCRCWRAVRWR